MMVYVHEIAANISSYCRNILSNRSSAISHDVTYCRVLFSPNLSEALTPHQISRHSGKSAAAFIGELLPYTL